MSEIVSKTALTSTSRVKDILYGPAGSQTASNDTLIGRYINIVSDFFERETGRYFVQRKYQDEEYTGVSKRQQRLVLRQFPVTYVFLAGNFTSGSNQITNCTNVNGLQVGMQIFCPGILNQNGVISTYITLISGTTLTVSQTASASQNAAQIQVSGMVNLQYRAGTPVTNPSWTDFQADQWILKDQGRAGVVRVYGVIPRVYDDMIRATYWAGYLVNWENVGDNLTHTLPGNISGTVENIVVRLMKRQLLGGKTSESLGGASVSWDKDLDTIDKMTIMQYKRAPIIIAA